MVGVERSRSPIPDCDVGRLIYTPAPRAAAAGANAFGTAVTAIFRSYTQAELDDCYDQRVWAKDAGQSIATMGTTSAAVRLTTPHEADVPYGGGEHARLDWFRGAPGGPVHVHIHGGAWRNLTKSDASSAAPAFVSEGVHYVALNFPKAPAARLTDIVATLAEALEYVRRAAPDHGADPSRILLSGHSSGAHLAAVLATLDWSARGLSESPFQALLCVSGTYDLEPVLLSARGEYIQLSAAESRTLSPLRQIASIRVPVTLVRGVRESPEFIRQADEFAERLRAVGRLSSFVVMPDADHFEVNEAFAIPGSPVHGAALDAIAGMASAATPAA